MIDMLKLKSQLKRYLDHRGWSTAKLARESGVSKQSISYWQGGGSPRRLDQLKRVADVLGTTVDHLAFGDGIEPDLKAAETDALELIFGEKDQWVTGSFEVKIRRIRK